MTQNVEIKTNEITIFITNMNVSIDEEEQTSKVPKAGNIPAKLFWIISLRPIQNRNQTTNSGGFNEGTEKRQQLHIFPSINWKIMQKSKNVPPPTFTIVLQLSPTRIVYEFCNSAPDV
ncbi:hypothetical protein JTB14_005513 [Gonioctena quinquepunctata]|nr:hypothetical protein JTB14_005513 [Gonioctena quinquepunctata]